MSSVMAFGLESLGGQDWGDFDLEAHRLALEEAWRLGVRVFDTAAAYGLGLSESRLSEILGPRRFEALIITKGGLEWDEPTIGRAQVRKNNSRLTLQKSIEGSLRRLRLEGLPVFLVHWPDGVTAVDDILESLRDFKTQGLIGDFGFSNFSVSDWSQILFRLGPRETIYCEMPFSLLSRPEDRDLLKTLRSRGVKILTYGALAQGLLSGKYKMDSSFLPSDRRHRLAQFRNPEIFRKVIPHLKKVADELNMGSAEVALKWVLGQGISDWLVVGCKNVDQVSKNFIALNSPLPRSVCQELENVFFQP